ncbi:kinase-like domain-containing protein [Cladorrhinum sp. PSN259]|nr:kinase-like domain-containing protein [Cladorrhinum sp. PSN259]
MEIPFVNHTFDQSDALKSSYVLAPFLYPRQLPDDAVLEVKALSQGTTNALFKVSRQTIDLTAGSAVLVKVYGDGTEITIDRDKEIRVHKLLAEKQLSSFPLVRFLNGHGYEFIPGVPCSDHDIRKERVWRGIARELARWHVTLPAVTHDDPEKILNFESSIWSTAKRWLDAISAQPRRSTATKDSLRDGFAFLTQKLLFSHTIPNTMVLGHGDLLSGNIIIQESSHGEVAAVRFIDYEHATYCPRAFEIANHFAEWAGFNCDYNSLPTRNTRREFIHEYLKASAEFERAKPSEVAESEIDELMGQVDAFRGFPGFYWGLCALIQAEESTGTIDFDYSGYAEKRLAEYSAWRKGEEGILQVGEELPLREKIWASP